MELHTMPKVTENIPEQSVEALTGFGTTEKKVYAYTS